MIPLKRIRTTVAVHANFTGAKRVDKNFELLKKKRDGLLDDDSDNKWDSSFWKQSKVQLLKETCGKCAYCETPTSVNQYGDVEHFRPKSKYWWLAYCYENYLVSCVACNQVYKKDFFLLRDNRKKLRGPKIKSTFTDAKLLQLAALLTVDPVNNSLGYPMTKFIKELSGEGSLLINPYFDNPATYLAYLPILENNEVVVVATSKKYEPFVEACNDLFGINRKELMDERFKVYSTYLTFKYTLMENIRVQLRNKINNDLINMASDKYAFAGMVRYLNTQPLSSLPWDFTVAPTA